MPYVEVKKTINAAPSTIYQIVKDMAAYPNFMKDLVSVEILERGDDYTISHWVSNVDGRKIIWTERDTFYPEQNKITYAQTEGDLKKMEGEWNIVPQGDACEVTLSDLEKTVVFFRAGGMSYDEICQRLNLSEKSVDNALRRARKKLKSVCSD